ncbi:MAG: MBL fold metallo-hydrolase, partial [Alphaproteobacteria bacterium]|nr:MBL fold metallo-hydrolase [Alphaproteobacteria bacterium]
MLNYHVEVLNFDGDLAGIKIHQFSSRGNYFVNSIIVETANCLVVYDVQDAAYAGELLKYTEQLNKPIARVIISHPHIDHYQGLPAFAGIPSYATAEVIADSKKKLEDKFIPQHALESNFNIDGLNYISENVVDSHCPNHGVLWIKELSCVLVADLAQYNGHLLAYDYAGFIKALEYILEKSQGYTTLLTGHGNITTITTLSENINYLTECQKIYLDSSSIEEFDKRIREKFPNRSRIKANLGLLLKDKSF